MGSIFETLKNIWETSGFYLMSADWRQLVMIVLACVLLYLGIVKKFEPLLLVGIACGMLLTNLPGAEVYHPELWQGEVNYADVLHNGALLHILYIGIKAGVSPSLIFLGVGAMTDFGPLIANPKFSSSWSRRSSLVSTALYPRNHAGASPDRKPRQSV